MAVDLLDKLDKESNQEQNKDLKIETVQDLSKIIEEWKKVNYELGINYNFYPMYKNHAIYQDLVNGVYDSKTISAFSLELGQYQNFLNESLYEGYSDSRAGLFLSVVINRCPEKYVKIYTKTMHQLPNFFGYLNKERIIYVFGDLGDHAGSFMVSGKLIVNGNVGDRIGYGKHGGIIEINGKCGSLDSYWGDEGSIYQNGKLLYGK